MNPKVINNEFQTIILHFGEMGESSKIESYFFGTENPTGLKKNSHRASVFAGK